MPIIKKIKGYAKQLLTKQARQLKSPWRAGLTRLLQIIYAVGRDLAEGQLTLRAMSLVYTSLLSLVPLLAVSFSVLKGFGVHNQLQPLLLGFLAPLGDKAVEITNQIISFVENIKVGVLGAIGLGMLLYTVTSLLQKVELSFNYIWHIKHSRPLVQRFSQYLSVLTIGPVLVFSALGITASLTSSAVVQALITSGGLGQGFIFLSSLVPHGLIILAFTFIYVFVPNTRVRTSSAVIGGTVAGILWETTGWLFASFVAGSGSYTAIYSGFAILIMFMIWLYLSWLILLVGASITFYHQHSEYLSIHRREALFSNRVKEKLTLMLIALIVQRYYHKQSAYSLQALAQAVNAPIHVVESILESLQQSGLLAITGDEPPGYLPATPPETTTVKKALDAVRQTEEGKGLNLEQLPGTAQVEALVQLLDKNRAAALAGLNLKDLAETRPETQLPVL